MVSGMSQAALRTDRLELVPLSEDDLPFLVDLNSDQWCIASSSIGA